MTDQPHQQVLDDLHPQYIALRDRTPDVYKGFAQLSSAASAPGNLDRSVEEVIALTIGLARGCDGCVASHADAAVKADVTIYGARAYTAFCELFDADDG